MTSRLLFRGFVLTALVLHVSATMPCNTVEDCTKTRMYVIPGPNPIVAPAASGWSATECEMAGGVFEVTKNEYVLVYHCLNNTESYNVGMSTAAHPLGL